MIKICSKSLTFPVKLIFISMLREGVFPEDWKKSNLVSIYKKESKKLIEDY